MVVIEKRKKFIRLQSPNGKLIKWFMREWSKGKNFVSVR